MSPALSLVGASLRTYDTIFQHPASPDLHWLDVRLLLAELGHLVMEPKGHLKATRNGHSFILHPPRTIKVEEPKDLLEIRRFLERSEFVPSGTPLAGVLQTA